VELAESGATGETKRAASAALIAIDGPVASGKTAVGHRLARALGYRLVDTGMMYRAVTWLALQRGIDPSDEPSLARLAREARIELGQPSAERVASLTVDGRDITNELRSPEVDRAVSLVSQFPSVRHAMVERQRELAREGRIIMLGRDIGSVVLPDAPLKVYLDASISERARRRYDELRENGAGRPLSEIQAELEQRDQMDRNRHTSPLHAAPGAHVIDTSDLALDEVVERVLALAGVS
jgi:cytidylate kinase